MTGYRQALLQAQQDLAELVRRRRDLDSEISQLNKLVNQLLLRMGQRTAGTADQSDLGLSDSITYLLSVTEGPLTAPEIRDGLADSGFPIHKHANPLSSIHTTLRRLTKRQRIIEVRRGHEKVWSHQDSIRLVEGA